MTLKKDDISYALGPKGGTRKKIAAASGAIVEYIGCTVAMSGNKKQRTRAREYMDWLFQQLDGPVTVDWKNRVDCTAVDVPTDCVGYITGARRAALGNVEQEFGCLMFFMETRMKGREKTREERREDRVKAEKDREAGIANETEKLLIFGSMRSRKGAQLKIMSCVETKARGYFTRGVEDHTSKYKGFSTDTMYLKDEDISYALGRGGSTRMKLAKASGCILQYVGNLVYLAGTKTERNRCRDYLNWLLDQRRGPVTITPEEVKGRRDVVEVTIPQRLVRDFIGNRGTELRRVEEKTGTFCFMAKDGTDKERLIIFGCEPRPPPRGQLSEEFFNLGPRAGEKMINEMIKDRLRDDGRGRGGRDRSRGRRRRSRSYSRGRRSPSYRGRYDSRSRSRGRGGGRRRSPSYKSRRSRSRGGRRGGR